MQHNNTFSLWDFQVTVTEPSGMPRMEMREKVLTQSKLSEPKVEVSATEEEGRKLVECFYHLYFNASGAEVCLKAQCFLSLTCPRIKSKCVRGEGFLISYFISYWRRGGGAKKILYGCREGG